MLPEFLVKYTYTLTLLPPQNLIKCFRHTMARCFTTEGSGLPKRKLQARKMVHESADFVYQNVLKLAYRHLSFQTNFFEVIPRSPLTGKRKREGKGR
jgi:hypothetical protein